MKTVKQMKMSDIHKMAGATRRNAAQYKASKQHASHVNANTHSHS